MNLRTMVIMMMMMMMMTTTIILLVFLIMIVIVITIIHLNSEFIFVLNQQPNDHFSQQKYKRE